MILGLAESRFVPAFNDKISGSPAYMRHIATAVAEALNAKLTAPAPILVAEDEARRCETVRGGGGFDPNHLFYLITYSETSYSYCLAVYGAPTAAAQKDRVITITSDGAQNYGERLNNPVQAIPIGHSAEKFALVYLSSLLHWRSDPQEYLKTAFPGRQQVPVTNVGLPGGQEINVNFLDLRPAIARRHNFTNFVLTSGLVFTPFLLLIALLRLWAIYKTAAAELTACGQTMTFVEFLLQNPDLLVSGARNLSQEKQRELDESERRNKSQTRTETILKQWQDEIRGKLQAGLNLSLPETERQRIRACLDKNDPEEMKALAEELQNFNPLRSAEDRLNSLLETLKQYCEPAELGHYRQEAFAALHDKGFRDAREFVVKAHAELRFRAKKSSA